MTKSQTNKDSGGTQETTLPTFMDHVHELKSRFFWVAIYFAISSAVVYPYFNTIISALTKPLGDHQLYYLTPSGGLSFVIKICLYLGTIGALPAIVYHLYNFIAPVMPRRNSRLVLMYTVSSLVLVTCGVLFAYFISLPAAVGFLVNFNIDNVSAMLTVDSYLSFVISYLIAGAVLFQLPLVMMIINSIHRLSPKQLMSYQRHNIVISFVLAAVLSPTPDVVNQSLLALPMVAMYQVGVFLVWIKNRKKKTVSTKSSLQATETERGDAAALPSVAVAMSSGMASVSAGKQQVATVKIRRSVDGFGANRQHTVPKTESRAAAAVAVQQIQKKQPPLVKLQPAAPPMSMHHVPRPVAAQQPPVLVPQRPAGGIVTAPPRFNQEMIAKRRFADISSQQQAASYLVRRSTPVAPFAAVTGRANFAGSQ